MRIAMAVLVALALAACATTPAGRTAADAVSTLNPAIDGNFPDPAVLRTDDGWYYVYATQGEDSGRMLNIQTARSRDLRVWERVGDALPVKPAWASETQDFWAPHVSEHDGRYFLYYSAKPDAATADKTRGLCLAVATADRPEGPFVDSGRPLLCGDSFVNIDPMAFDDPATGKRLLYWGSGFKPIKVQELAADRVSLKPGSAPVDLVATVPDESPANYRRLVEGAWVVQREGWYYLFYSGDNCCGPNAHYATLVARSRSAMGPFETLPGLVHEASGIWLAPGHNSVITDANGRTWSLFHAVDTRHARSRPSDEINSRRAMLVKELVWDNGVPKEAR